MLRVLGVHAFYRQRGGEDIAFETEMELLRARGHAINTFTTSNSERSGFTLARQVVWNARAAAEIDEVISSWRPDVLHTHNTFPSLSPSVIVRASEKIPVVTTFHNYRLVCANGVLLKNSQPCERCLTSGHQFAAVYHCCYRNSAAASAAVAIATTAHRVKRVWPRHVSRAVALTAFAKSKLIKAGFSEEQVVVKPNFVDVPFEEKRERPFVLYAGRLSPEKGISTLLQAFGQVKSAIELHIAGTGPLEADVRAAASATPRIKYLGLLDRRQVLEQLRAAMLAICPSICYEGFPLFIAEAYGCGTPVVASDIGSLSELVRPGITGELVSAGEADVLAQVIDRLGSDVECRRRLSARARQTYETHYTPDTAYASLMKIYESAIHDWKH